MGCKRGSFFGCKFYMSHTRKGIESGATKEEIRHAILMALSTTGFPSMVAAFGWVDEVFKKSDK